MSLRIPTPSPRITYRDVMDPTEDYVLIETIRGVPIYMRFEDYIMHRFMLIYRSAHGPVVSIFDDNMNTGCCIHFWLPIHIIGPFNVLYYCIRCNIIAHYSTPGHPSFFIH